MQQSREKILIVDDEIFNVYSLQLILSNMGFKNIIEYALNGEQAIKLMKEELGMKSH
jgi:CheY-like chemotaxis protein